MWLLLVVVVSAADGGAELSKDQRLEETWRQRFRAAHEKIATLQAQLDADQQLLGGLEVSGGVSRSGRPRAAKAEYGLAQARVQQNQKKLEQAKTALDDLERRASTESVPREWRQ